MNLEDAKVLKNNVHMTFETPQGKETMKFLEKIGGWIPSIYDSGDTNEIIARDANRRLIGTLKSIMNLTAEQLVTLTQEV
jgi:hypothetical protein